MTAVDGEQGRTQSSSRDNACVDRSRDGVVGTLDVKRRRSVGFRHILSSLVTAAREGSLA